VLQQPALAVESAAVAGQLSIRSDHSMARHHDPDRVGTVGETNGPAGGGVAYTSGQFAVRGGSTGWDLAQRRPHSELERRAVGFNRYSVDGGDLAFKIRSQRATNSRGRGSGCQAAVTVMHLQQPVEAVFVISEVQRPQR